MNRHPTSRAARAGAALAATSMAVSLTACGSDDTGTGTGTGGAPALPGKVDEIAAMVPDAIADKGTLVVAAATYPPAVIEQVGGGEVTGWDIENTRQIAAVLGLDVEFRVIPFDGVITGLAANRYDAATGEIYVTPERTDRVTFVTNHESTDALLVPKDSDIASADSMTDLCGLTLAAELSSAEAALIREIAQECETKGEDKVTPKTFQAQANVNLALSEGRIDAAVSSASQVAYVLDQAGDQFRLVELPWAPDYDTGLALARNDNTDQLAEAVQAATNHLIENGQLQEILDEFNDGQGGIEKAEILPAQGE
jgi:polar amino acid transport system substrate-binding protein